MSVSTLNRIKVVLLYSGTAEDEFYKRALKKQITRKLNGNCNVEVHYCSLQPNKVEDESERLQENNSARIRKETNNARLFVLLVSRVFIAGKYLWYPLVKGWNEYLPIIPVMLSDLPEPDPILAAFRSLPDNKEPLNQLSDTEKEQEIVSSAIIIVERIREQIYEENLYSKLVSAGASVSYSKVTIESFNDWLETDRGTLDAWCKQLIIQGGKRDRRRIRQEIERQVFARYKSKRWEEEERKKRKAIKRPDQEELQATRFWQATIAATCALVLVLPFVGSMISSETRKNCPSRDEVPIRDGNSEDLENAVNAGTDYFEYLRNGQYQAAWKQLLSDEYKQREFQYDYGRYEQRWKQIEKIGFNQIMILLKNYDRDKRVKMCVKWEYCIRGDDRLRYKVEHWWLRQDYQRGVWVLDRSEPRTEGSTGKRCSEGLSIGINYLPVIDIVTYRKRLRIARNTN